MVDDALLLAAELGETEDAMEHVDGGRRGGGHGFTLCRSGDADRRQSPDRVAPLYVAIADIGGVDSVSIG